MHRAASAVSATSPAIPVLPAPSYFLCELEVPSPLDGRGTLLFVRCSLANNGFCYPSSFVQVPPASAKQHGVNLNTASTPFQQASGYGQHGYGAGMLVTVLFTGASAELLAHCNTLSCTHRQAMMT